MVFNSKRDNIFLNFTLCHVLGIKKLSNNQIINKSDFLRN